MFDIITITGGRTTYLNRLLKSISLQDHSLVINHTIVFQDNCFQKEFSVGVPQEYLEKLTIIKREDKRSVGKILNETRPDGKASPYTIKFDDDAMIRSQNFFFHALEVTQLIPESVFSPFPVGLINNMGGVQSSDRRVIYGDMSDTYYTFRKVNHVGGFARVSPTNLMKSVSFSDSHNEDTEFSSYCSQKGVGMFYLDNALIVEHQESTLGQHARYGESYFKGRF